MSSQTKVDCTRIATDQKHISYLDGHIEFIIQDFLEGLNTPRALTVWLLYVNGEHEQLVSLPLPDQETYSYSDPFFRDYQATVLLRKSTFLETGIDTKARALSKLQEAESHCKQSNERFRTSDLGLNQALNPLIYRVKRKISSVLGPFDLDEFFSGAGWGPGATFSLPRKRATPVDKMLEHRITVTSDCYQIARSLIGRDIHWAQARGIPADGPCSLLASEFQIVKGNRVVTVPKDARSDRPIAIEPTANLFFQKGIGKMIRNRLRRVGVDLNDQSKNAELSRVGSIDGSVSTIDLSSASDTVCRELVRRVLPDDWAVWCERLRSKYSTIDGTTFVMNEKFSSMGNGFTFELESLIFWALASLFDPKASVYGDDIVVSTDVYPDVICALIEFGFLVNYEKSFSTGRFRESCGSHYFGGFNVKPIYIKDHPCNSVVDYIGFANSLLLFSSRIGIFGFDPRPLPAWRRAVREFDLHVYTVFDGDNTLPIGLAFPRHHRRLAPHFTWSRSTGVLRLPGLSYRPGRFRHHWSDSSLAYTLRFSPEVPISDGFPTKRGGAYVVRHIQLNGRVTAV